MPLLLRLVPILVLSSRVQDYRVLEELHVSRLEIHIHVKSGFVSDRIKQVERLSLAWRRSRYLRKPLRVADVPSDVEDCETSTYSMKRVPALRER